MARPAYRLLAYSLWDLIPIVMAVAHFAFVLWLVLDFHALSWWLIVPAALLYSVSLSWSINSISHNQIHNAYFTPAWLNRAFDLLLSVTIGFSQTLYRDIHNRHHRGNSDRPDASGKTVDPLSIYQRGKHGQPENPWAYTFLSFFRDDPKPIFTEMRRTNHRHQIAAHIARKPRIGDDHTHKVFARQAPLAEQDGRHAQPFLPNLRRTRIIAAMRGAADIRVMRAHNGPEHDAPFGEDRHNGGEVRQMRPAMIGVVQ